MVLLRVAALELPLPLLLPPLLLLLAPLTPPLVAGVIVTAGVLDVPLIAPEVPLVELPLALLSEAPLIELSLALPDVLLSVELLDVELSVPVLLPVELSLEALSLDELSLEALSLDELSLELLSVELLVELLPELEFCDVETDEVVSSVPLLCPGPAKKYHAAPAAAANNKAPTIILLVFDFSPSKRGIALSSELKMQISSTPFNQTGQSNQTGQLGVPSKPQCKGYAIETIKLKKCEVLEKIYVPEATKAAFRLDTPDAAPHNSISISLRRVNWCFHFGAEAASSGGAERVLMVERSPSKYFAVFGKQNHNNPAS